MAEQKSNQPWTGSEIAATISLDPDLLARGDTWWNPTTKRQEKRVIGPDRARELIASTLQSMLIPGEYKNEDDAAAAAREARIPEMAQLIVEALPADAMNEGVIAAIDLRPYIQLVASQPDRPILGDRTRQGFKPLINAWQQAQNVDIQAGGQPYRGSTTAGVSPATTATEQAPQTPGGLEQYPGMQGSTVDLSDMAYLLRTGQVDLTNPDLLASPMDVGNIPGVFTNAPSGQPRVTQRELPSGKVIGRTTVGGALDWVYGLNEQEVSTLQALVASAGYMTDMHYDPQTDQTILQDYSYEDGYANDAVFQQAWRTAVMEAKANQVPLGQWLTRKTAEFKQREDSFRKRLTEERIGTFNSALTDVRTAADRLAMDTVGRRLRPEEFVQVRQYLRSLQQERIDDPYTNTPDDWMKSDPQRGFTQDELTGQVSSVLEPEMMRSRQVEADRQLRSWLGMD